VVVDQLADDSDLRGRPNTGHRNDSGKEPLELYELGAQIADGRRTHRDRFHAVSGRRPDKLYGSGYVSRLSDEARNGRDADDQRLWRAVRVGQAFIRAVSDVLRRNTRKPEAGRIVSFRER